MEERPSKESPLEISSTSRRDFLKKSAIAGAVVWSAPAISTLPSGRAWADHYNGDHDGDGTITCDCFGEEAWALQVRVLDDLLTVGPLSLGGGGKSPVSIGGSGGGNDPIFQRYGLPGPAGSLGCENGTITIALGGIIIEANLLCAETSNCFARSTVADIKIAGLGGLIQSSGEPVDVLEVSVLTAAVKGSGCDPLATSHVAGVRLHKRDKTVSDLIAATDPNFNLQVLGLVEVILNEQLTGCDDDSDHQFTEVNALHVKIPVEDDPNRVGGIIDIIAGHAKVISCECSCNGNNDNDDNGNNDNDKKRKRNDNDGPLGGILNIG